MATASVSASASGRRPLWTVSEIPRVWEVIGRRAIANASVKGVEGIHLF